LPSIGVIINPTSRKNRRRPPGRAERLARLVGRFGEVYETRGVDELRRAVGRLLERGVDYLVSDGGDGSMHCALNEARDLLGGAESELPCFVPTNGGTVDAVARKVGIQGGAEKILLELRSLVASEREPPIVELDSLLVSGERRMASGEVVPFSKLGFALAAGGIGQRFFDKYYAEREPGAGAIVSVVAQGVGSWLGARVGLPLPSSWANYGRELFRPTRARVSIDGQELPDFEHGAIHAGAFDVSLSGVFHVFPLAREPGKIHFQAGGILPTEMIRALPDLYRGRAIKSRRLVERAGTRMLIEAIGDELLRPILDGESYTDLTRLSVQPGPRVRVPQVTLRAGALRLDA
jgi:diacylglycerol kinase family enzyme